MRYLWLLAALAVAALGQTESAVSREGVYWVQSVNGSIAVPPGGRLRASSPAATAFQGQPAGDLQYTLIRKVKAKDQAEAQRYLRETVVKAERQGDWVVVVATGPRGPCQLRIRGPRQLREVVLSSQEGAIEAYDLDGDLKVETGCGNVQADRIRGAVTANTGGGAIQLGTVGGGARCVTGAGSIHAESIGGATALESGGGEILIKQVWGPLRTVTGGGNIRVEQASSTVNANTSGGLIEVVQAGGQVTAATSGGAIKVGHAQGVRAESAAGAIRLTGAAGPLKVSTVVGSIFAQLARSSVAGDSFLTSGSGDITVLIPSNLAVTIQAMNQSPGGRVISDFPQVRVTDDPLRMRAPLRAEGALNGGGPTLRLTTSRGTIFLKRE